ncbi:MAG: hypothetical protein AN487_21520 [Anabaena sp. CRKS33]|nr:MAG: hypothetical protein AN487_21520 [Anabaena sp. CRKS33]
MNRDDIINLARQHGKPVQEQNAEVEYLFTLEGVNALLAAEREACVKACQSVIEEIRETADNVLSHEDYRSIQAVQDCITVIRARGQS